MYAKDWLRKCDRKLMNSTQAWLPPNVPELPPSAPRASSSRFRRHLTTSSGQGIPVSQFSTVPSIDKTIPHYFWVTLCRWYTYLNHNDLSSLKKTSQFTINTFAQSINESQPRKWQNNPWEFMSQPRRFELWTIVLSQKLSQELFWAVQSSTNYFFIKGSGWTLNSRKLVFSELTVMCM